MIACNGWCVVGKTYTKVNSEQTKRPSPRMTTRTGWSMALHLLRHLSPPYDTYASQRLRAMVDDWWWGRRGPSWTRTDTVLDSTHLQNLLQQGKPKQQCLDEMCLVFVGTNTYTAVQQGLMGFSLIVRVGVRQHTLFLLPLFSEKFVKMPTGGVSKKHRQNAATRAGHATFR